MVRLSLVLFVALGSFQISAQTKIVFFIPDSLGEGINYEKQVADKYGAEMQANKIATQLINKGFLTASVDSIHLKNDTAFVSLYKGRKFNWGEISYKHLPKPMIVQFGFDLSTTGVAGLDGLKNSMSQTIGHFENRGYPFAYFYWDSLVIQNDTIYGALYFEKNVLIAFDTIALYGEPGVTKQFLYNYLGFKPGQPYNESVVSRINDKLIKLPFTSILSKPQVFFVGRKAIILLNLKKRRIDRLDGIVGFAPNTGVAGNTKLLVTGEFHLDFKNLKGSGRQFKADWQSFKARSQTLNVGLNLPYLLNQPFGIEIAGDFLKYDTVYTETRFGMGVQYIFSGLDNVKLFYEQRNTNLQSIDTNIIRQNKKLGELTGMKTFRYGIGLNTVTFDNRVSPRKGYLADLNFSLFKRVIVKDERINRVKFYNSANDNYYTVYDSARLNSYQLLFQYTLGKPFLLSSRFVLFSEVKGFHFISPNVYFNELYRFGGNNTLKGFNEQSLFASSLAIINLEVRYLLSEYSFLKVFGNTSYYQDKSDRPNKISEDIPYGFGAGINLETGGGIFNISVALGKSKFNPIDFKNTKVHFGLINYF